MHNSHLSGYKYTFLGIRMGKCIQLIKLHGFKCNIVHLCASEGHCPCEVFMTVDKMNVETEWILCFFWEYPTANEDLTWLPKYLSFNFDSRHCLNYKSEQVHLLWSGHVC